MNQQPPPGNRYPAPGPPPHQYPQQGNAWQGQPGQPWQQGPPPGQPAMPGQGQPPGPGGPPWQAGMAAGPPSVPPRKRGPKRAVIVIVVVVALVAGAGGFWFLTRDSSGDKPNTPAAKDYDAAIESLGAAEVAWRVSQQKTPALTIVQDYWVTDKHLVRRLSGRVVAYDLKSGEEAWTYTIEGPPKDYCKSSQEHSNNRVALLISTDDTDGHDCGKLAVLDIGTGEEVFSTELVAGQRDPVPVSTDTLAVFGERVLISGDAGRVLDLTSGGPVSVPSGFSACDGVAYAVFGEVLLAESDCAEDGANDVSTRLRAFDANLGLAWEWTTPKDAENGGTLPVLGVLSLDPLVLELGFAGRPSQLVRVDPKSGKTVQFKDYDATTDDPEYMKVCNDYSLVSCETGRVVDNKLVITTTLDQINPDSPEAAGQQSTEFRNELVAFDLDTGEPAWRTGQVAGRLLSLVRADGDSGLVAYQPENPNGSKGMLLSVDPGTGKAKPLMPLGPKAHEDYGVREHRRAANFGADNHRAVYREGLFVVFTITHRIESEGEADTVAFAVE